MIGFIVRRLIQAILVVILTTGVVFFIGRMLPGDPVLIYMSQEYYMIATPEEVAAVRHEYGLDRPIPVQYASWISDLLHGNLGYSIIKHQSVSSGIGSSLPITLHIGILSFLISQIIGIPVGVICAARRGKWIDTILTISANIGITAPSFWVGILLIYVFGLWLGWLPTHGYTPPFEDVSLSLRQLIMPVFCLSVFPLAAIVRQTRSAMLEVIHQDYIRTAWSKGLRERSVIFRHALKNGMLSVITIAGTFVSAIVGGQVLIETVFGIPGMGKMAVDALLNRDYAVVQSVVLIVAMIVVLTNLVVDISYGWLDPRVHYE